MVLFIGIVGRSQHNGVWELYTFIFFALASFSESIRLTKGFVKSQAP